MSAEMFPVLKMWTPFSTFPKGCWQKRSREPGAGRLRLQPGEEQSPRESDWQSEHLSRLAQQSLLLPISVFLAVQESRGGPEQGSSFLSDVMIH